jgi:hypothetical protein
VVATLRRLDEIALHHSPIRPRDQRARSYPTTVLEG